MTAFFFGSWVAAPTDTSQGPPQDSNTRTQTMTTTRPPPAGAAAVSSLDLAFDEMTVATFPGVTLEDGGGCRGEGVLTCTSR